jgi:transposase
MAKIAKKTKRYPSDLTDEEWDQIAPLMPKPGRRGRPREVDFREVINAVRYLVRSGGGWWMLPIHFGPWETVYGWFRELARRFLFQTIHDVALMVDRERAGREASPSAGVIDSQSVKAPHSKTRGYDAGKKIVGRKRHIAANVETGSQPALGAVADAFDIPEKQVLASAPRVGDNGIRQCSLALFQLRKRFVTPVPRIDIDHEHAADAPGCEADIRSRTLCPP